MKNHRQSLWPQVWGLTLLIAVAGAGCSRQARQARHLERADRYYAQQDHARAEIEYLNALRAGATNVEVFERLAEMLFTRGDLNRAAPFLLQTERLAPDNVTNRLRLASLYLLARQLDQARQQALAVLERQPTNAEAVLVLADAARTREEVLETFARLEALQRQTGDHYSYELAAGNLHFRQGELQTAAAAFERALQLNPQATAAHVGLGNVYWRQGNLAQADQAFEAAAAQAKPTSLERLKWIEFRLRTGQIEKAKSLLDQTIREAPDFLAAKAYAAEIALAERRFAACEELLQDILAKNANYLDALLLQARLRLAQQQAGEAAAQLERLATKFPESAKVHFWRAVAALDNDDSSKAISSLDRALALEPAFPDAILLLAELNLSKGDAEPAIQALSRLLQDQPKLKKAHALLAAAYVARGKLDEAVAAYRRLLELAPDDRLVPVQLAATLIRLQKPDEARAVLEQLLANQPNELTAIALLVNLDLQAQQLPQALARAQQAVAANPQSAPAQYLLARVYQAQADPTRAESALRRAVELDADYQPAYAALARLYLGANRYEQALAELETLIEKNPKDAASLMLAGTLYDKLGRPEQAAAAYRKVIAAQPRSAVAMNNLAYLCVEKLGDAKQAYELAQRARELRPLDPFIADTLGWVLYRRGESQRALSLFQEAAQKLSSEPEVLFHLGLAYYALGEESAARDALTQALQLGDEPFAGKAEAQQRLAVLNLALDAPDALQRLEARLAEEPSDTIARLRLAALQERKGDFAKARETYERLLAAKPETVPALLRLSELLAERFRELPRALELAKRARDLAPADSSTLYQLGRLALATGNSGWSLSLLQEAAQRAPAEPKVRRQLAWAYLATGRVPEAQAAMKSALASTDDPTLREDATQFVNLLQAYLDASAGGNAVDAAQAKLAQQPDDLPALLVLGRSRELAGNLDEAKSLYERLLQKYPDCAVAAKHLAGLLAAGTSDLQRAFDLAQKARQTLPEDAELTKTLGKIAYLRGDYRWAVQLFKLSARQRESDAELYYLLGLALDQLNEREESVAALRRALALNDQAQLAAEARRVLAQSQ